MHVLALSVPLLIQNKVEHGNDCTPFKTVDASSEASSKEIVTRRPSAENTADKSLGGGKS